jgi:hypothetical protein
MKAKKYVITGLLLGALFLGGDMQGKSVVKKVTGFFVKIWNSLSDDQKEAIKAQALDKSAQALGLSPQQKQQYANYVQSLQGMNEDEIAKMAANYLANLTTKGEKNKVARDAGLSNSEVEDLVDAAQQ